MSTLPFHAWPCFAGEIKMQSNYHEAETFPEQLLASDTLLIKTTFSWVPDSFCNVAS